LHIPEPGRAIRAGGSESLAIRRECHAVHDTPAEEARISAGLSPIGARSVVLAVATV
jgi:hypothetical protein